MKKQSLDIIKEIRVLDEFLCSHPEYKNRILESNSELDFARLNEGKEGACQVNDINERIEILKRYLPGRVLADASNYRRLETKANRIHANTFSVINAVCLALTAAMFAEGLCETIPAHPDMDDEGLYMQVVAPRKGLEI